MTDNPTGVQSLARHLIRGVSGSFGVQVGGLFFSMASSVMLARALGTHGYGAYALALAWLEFFKIPVAYGHPLLIQRELAVRSVEGNWGVVRGLLRRCNQAVLLLSLILGLGFYFLKLAGWTSIFGAGLDIGAFQIALLMLPFLGLSAVRSGALNGLHYAASSLLAENLVRPVLTMLIVGVVWLALREDISPTTAMLMQLGAVIGAFLVGRMLLAKVLPSDFRSVRPVYRSREWAKAVWPFMLASGAFATWGTLGIIILGWYRPPAEVGIYRVAVLVGSLAQMPTSAFNLTIAPTIARLHAIGDREKLQKVISYSTLAVVAISVLALAGFALIGQPLLRIVFGPEYVVAYIPLLALAFGNVLYSCIWTVMVTLDMSGHQRFSLYSLITSAVANTVMAIVLVPYAGMTGAALATGMSWFIGHLWLLPVARRKTGLHVTIAYATRFGIAQLAQSALRSRGRAS